MAPKSIKIIYFDLRGRAEVSRLILACAGQSFEDVRLTKETWPIEKPNSPFGQLPLIEVDGKRYAQGIAIATYCAREFGLYGKTNLDGLQIDQIVQLGMELWNLSVPAYYESDKEKKAELMENLKDVLCPKYMGFFERLLKESGSSYFVSNALTLADIFVYDLVYAFSRSGLFSVDISYPKLHDLYNKVESNNNIKAYLAKRKDTAN